MSIEDNVKIRKTAQAVYDLAYDESLKLGDSDASKFWETIAQLIDFNIDPLTKQEYDPKKMSDKEAKLFGHTTIPFGRHAGERVDDIPMSYLTWLADDGFIDNVRRYLKSDRIEVEQKD